MMLGEQPNSNHNPDSGRKISGPWFKLWKHSIFSENTKIWVLFLLRSQITSSLPDLLGTLHQCATVHSSEVASACAEVCGWLWLTVTDVFGLWLLIPAPPPSAFSLRLLSEWTSTRSLSGSRISVLPLLVNSYPVTLKLWPLCISIPQVRSHPSPDRSRAVSR